MTPEIQALLLDLEREGYVAEPQIATAAYLAREMRKPLLVEGDAGVGKTELAKVLARLLGAELIRLQCYEGLDVQTALYEWDYPRQLLRLRMAEGQGQDPREVEAHIFSREYLLERPLLRAITRDAPAGAADRRDRPRGRRLRGVPAGAAVGLPGRRSRSSARSGPSTRRTSC